MSPKKKALPSPLPEGFILTDSEKKKWRLGKNIGKGGFGLIYLASLHVDAPVGQDCDHVIKVEYHENGPLFSELKFYQRAAKPDLMLKWKKGKRLDFLGIPAYWGSGLTEHNGTRYRFMVIDRLGADLQTIFLKNGQRLKKHTVLQLGRQMLDVLEYIHDNEYVHADIKAANLLLSRTDQDKVYLADYGLAYRYCPDGVHKEYKENPKKGHNGTMEYTSTDAHNGVAPSRRGDLEVLGYCLLHWLCGALPWLSMLRSPVQVQEAKAKLMANLPDSVVQLSPPSTSCEEVATFLCHVKALGYTEQPDYQALRTILSGPTGPLDLSGSREAEAARAASHRKTSQVKPAARPPRPKPVVMEDDGDDDDDEARQITQKPTKVRQPPLAYRPPPKSTPAAAESKEHKGDSSKPVASRTRGGVKQRQLEQRGFVAPKRVVRTVEQNGSESWAPGGGGHVVGPHYRETATPSQGGHQPSQLWSAQHWTTSSYVDEEEDEDSDRYCREGPYYEAGGDWHVCNLTEMERKRRSGNENRWREGDRIKMYTCIVVVIVFLALAIMVSR